MTGKYPSVKIDREVKERLEALIYDYNKTPRNEFNQQIFTSLRAAVTEACKDFLKKWENWKEKEVLAV